MARQASEIRGATVCRGTDDGMLAQEFCCNTGSPPQRWRRVVPQPAAREGRAGLRGMADKPVVLKKPGSTGGGKGP